MPQRSRGTYRKPAAVIDLDSRRGAVPPGWKRLASSSPAQPRPILDAWGRVRGYSDPLARGADPNARGPVAPRYIVGNLKGLGQETGGGVTVSPELVVAEVQRLAALYDQAAPQVSFSRWAADQGAGGIVDQFKALLRAAGDTETLAFLDATPAPPQLSPEQKIAALDAPTTGGPWALDVNGNWFTVGEGLPGEVIESDGRAIYVPAEHPSVRVKETGGYGTGSAHLKRWTEQKFRVANRVMLGPDPFKNLFHRVAPRGGWGGGQGFGRAFEGTPGDYDHEGGELYPELEGGALAQSLADWYGKNNFDARFGYDRGLTLNWLRVYTDAEGYRRYKPWTDAELADFFERWHMASPGYVGSAGEIAKAIGSTSARQRERQAAQTEGDYSVHWAWPIGPLSQFEPTSSSRRRKNLKKAAAVAAVVVGAVFLGPMIAGAIKGVAAKGALAKAGGVLSKAGKLIPKVVQGVNAARTVKAVRDGEVPPPPIELTGSRFVDYATAIGTNLVQSELAEQGQEMAAAERALLEQQMANQVRYYQEQAARSLPVSPSQVPMYALPNVSPAVQRAMQGSGDTWKLAAAAGGALILGLLLMRSR
jgi:hypothetical protein